MDGLYAYASSMVVPDILTVTAAISPMSAFLHEDGSNEKKQGEKKEKRGRSTRTKSDHYASKDDSYITEQIMSKSSHVPRRKPLNKSDKGSGVRTSSEKAKRSKSRERSRDRDDEKTLSSKSEGIRRAKLRDKLDLHAAEIDNKETKKPTLFAHLSPLKISRDRPKSAPQSPKLSPRNFPGSSDLSVELQAPKSQKCFIVKYSDGEGSSEKVVFFDVDGIKICNSSTDLQGQLHPVFEVTDFTISKSKVKWTLRGIPFKLYTEEEEEIQKSFLECLQQASATKTTTTTIPTKSDETDDLELKSEFSSTENSEVNTKQRASSKSSPSRTSTEKGHEVNYYY